MASPQNLKSQKATEEQESESEPKTQNQHKEDAKEESEESEEVKKKYQRRTKTQRAKETECNRDKKNREKACANKTGQTGRPRSSYLAAISILVSVWAAFIGSSLAYLLGPATKYTVLRPSAVYS